MSLAATLAWKYIILPLILKVVQKELQEFLASMSLAEFVNWLGTIKTYHEPEDFPNPPIKPKSTCNLKTSGGTPVNQ